MPIQQLAETHAAQLRREAAAAQLVALARCCRPGAWDRTARRAISALRRHVVAVRPGPAAGCCPA